MQGPAINFHLNFVNEDNKTIIKNETWEIINSLNTVYAKLSKANYIRNEIQIIWH